MVRPFEVKRPKYIDLMISMRDGEVLPVKVKTIEKMTLFENCFGKTFGGWDKKLKFKPHVACYSSINEMSQTSAACSRAMKTLVKSATTNVSKSIDKQFMEFCMNDSIGVHCHPKCGGCKCGGNDMLVACSPFDPEEEKALGLRWDTANDIVYVKVDLQKPPRKLVRKSMRLLLKNCHRQLLPSSHT